MLRCTPVLSAAYYTNAPIRDGGLIGSILLRAGLNTRAKGASVFWGVKLEKSWEYGTKLLYGSNGAYCCEEARTLGRGST